MGTIPILSRLSWEDYKRLSLTIIILLLECVLRFLAWLLPVSLLDSLRYHVLGALPRIFQHQPLVEHSEDQQSHDYQRCRLTPELIRFHGYGVEEHLVVTSDGYVLQLHRISVKDPRGRDVDRSVPPSPAPSDPFVARPVILALHGALLSSEIWVCQRQTRDNLVFALAEDGYDVWLANRRGTKYSQKHLLYKPHEERFWDYSLDETIMHDVPAMVEHILGSTGMRSLSILGFSQGTAEALGALAFNRKLQRRVDCMVGLSATAKPPTPANALIKSMVHWTPELVFLLFGRRSMLRSVFFWQSVLSVRAMSWLIELSMRMLFGWNHRNIRAQEKPWLYRHLFDSAAVKQVAHWFQIMRSGRFQLFDDEPASRTHRPPQYPLSNIYCPLLLFLGARDCLSDAEFVRDQLSHAELHLIEEYEHMDTLWASNVHAKVNRPILDFLKANAVCCRKRLGTDSTNLSVISH